MENNNLPLWVNLLTIAVAFLGGGFLTYFFFNKKQRFDADMARRRLSNELEEKRQSKFEAFQNTLVELSSLSSSVTSNELQRSFWACASSANNYFNTLEKIAENINSSAVDVKSWETSNYLKIKEAVEESFPVYYEVMLDVAQTNSIQFSDSLKKEKYPNIVSLLKGRLSSQEFDNLFNVWS